MTIFNPEKGTWVLLSFVAFFGVIVAVNTVFITSALRTHSGVITEKPYEKGLAFDDMLEEARSQPELIQKARYKDGVLTWEVKDQNGQSIKANVKANVIWPIKDGYDFEIELNQTASGQYETELHLPFPGLWDAQLEAQWDTQRYQTRLSFLAE